MHQIQWTSTQVENIDKFFGRVNSILIFEVCRYTNPKFDDPYILTSGIIAMDMVKNKSLDDIKSIAQAELDRFITTLCY